ncbi:MAG TPA: 16S rRNA (cytidine(1402)-2'-O)-methyltransferase [Clostridiales bacterium]|nr:16S rRNA (cytidine(1402)-2'-O)-methyltransferase [Candidatus Apopatosoma intestinale]
MSSIKSPEKYISPETEKNKTKAKTLYLVGTPIGNLADISERALKTLSEVDFVAAEDTRNSGRLLSYFGIKKPMVSYFEHNKRERGEEIVRRIEDGASCALITDAGMPAISDPGEDIVRLCAERGIPVCVVPGACAAVSALAVSGLPTSRFVFEGFLSTAKAERRKSLEALKNERRTVILYEAPHKLVGTLADIFAVLGDRRLSLCRELTKLNEEVIRTTVSGAMKYYEEKAPRGEYVLILEGASEDDVREEAFWSGMSMEEHTEHYISLGMTKKDAIKAVASDRGLAKSEVYAEVMKK